MDMNKGTAHYMTIKQPSTGMTMATDCFLALHLDLYNGHQVGKHTAHYLTNLTNLLNLEKEITRYMTNNGCSYL